MARREIPEINAGSMADIAFLLLIFFLVTTTMDKDTAYLRKIPKKVETNQPQTPIQQKNIYKITINSKQVIQARDSIIKPEDIGSLNKRIKHFYTVNRGKKSLAEGEKNYPFYAYGTISLYKEQLQSQENRLELLEAIEHPDDMTEKMIDQAMDAINKWRDKLDMMEMYVKYSHKREMPEIDFEAHIRLESFINTDYSAYVAVISEVEKAVTELRDEEAKELFGTTYSAMERISLQNATENTPEMRELRKRMELIETLFPLKLIEVKPNR